jgi:hypothetical protein
MWKAISQTTTPTDNYFFPPHTAHGVDWLQKERPSALTPLTLHSRVPSTGAEMAHLGNRQLRQPVTGEKAWGKPAWAVSGASGSIWTCHCGEVEGGSVHEVMSAET